MDVATFLSAVAHEVAAAQAKHPPINSAHEGLAVLWEEFEEFKAEVWKRVSDRDPAAMTAELIQIAAMCARTAADLSLPTTAINDVAVQDRTTGDRISRETLQKLQFLQEHINLFHGYRQLWAEAVANGRPLLISREALEREQTKTISIIAYAALELHQTVFPGRSPHARFQYQAEQPDEE